MLLFNNRLGYPLSPCRNNAFKISSKSGYWHVCQQYSSIYSHPFRAFHFIPRRFWFGYKLDYVYPVAFHENWMASESAEHFRARVAIELASVDVSK